MNLVNPKDIPISTTPGVMFCSKIRVAIECFRKYYYQYVRNLQPTGTSLPLFIGSMVHMAMDDFYGGMSPDDVCGTMEKHIRNEMHKKGIGRDSDELTKHTAMIQGMVAGYMAVYKDDLKEWNIISREQSFQMQDDLCSTVVTLDTLLTKPGKLNFNDFKTAASIDGEMLKNLGFDMQVQTYWRVVEAVLNMKISEAYYTIIKKPKIRQKQTETAEDYANRVMDLYTETPDDYFHRETIKRNQKHIDDVKNDVDWYVKDIMRKYETGDEDVILNPRNWPRNAKACRNFFRNCPFTDICRYGETTDKFLYFTERQGTERGYILTDNPSDKPKLLELQNEIRDGSEAV